jgi:hypothetical protein
MSPGAMPRLQGLVLIGLSSDAANQHHFPDNLGHT